MSSTQSSHAKKSIFNYWFSNANEESVESVESVKCVENGKDNEGVKGGENGENGENEKTIQPQQDPCNNKVIDLSQTDSVVTSVVQSFLQRAEFGLNKYGKTMDRDDLTMLQWIQHAQEEHMDAILYLEKLKQLETKRINSIETIL